MGLTERTVISLHSRTPTLTDTPSPPLCPPLQVERLSKSLAMSQQSGTDAKERCSTLEAELRRMQGRRDALIDENTALSHKVGPCPLPPPSPVPPMQAAGPFNHLSIYTGGIPLCRSVFPVGLV